MFTGIIEGLGEVRNIRLTGGEATITVKVPPFLSDCHEGDSISVDGVCLTITGVRGESYTLDVSAETVKRSTLGALAQGTKVNLERALRLSDRIGGHLVSGHVDGTGVIEKIEKVQRSWRVQIRLHPSLSRYLIEKGSVAVDGISLTITTCMGDSFTVIIIPQTASLTTILHKRSGDKVNIEIDMISKYIEKLLSREKRAIPREPPSRIDRNMLIRYGFGEENGHF
jgi:riboflavin synthase